MSNMSSCTNRKIEQYNYNPAGHPTGIRYLSDVKVLISKRDLQFQPTAPVEALGNCFPDSVIHGLHRPEVYASLSQHHKDLAENHYLLRLAIVDFLKNISCESTHFGVINASRANWTEMARYDDDMESWDARIERLSKPGDWFEDMTMKYTSCFLNRDIICFIMSGDIKYCPQNISDVPSDFPCGCTNEPLYMVNIRDVHYQSVIPLQNTNIDPTYTKQQREKTKNNLIKCNDPLSNTKKIVSDFIVETANSLLLKSGI